MDNRAEVREFLISRRAKITPQQAGMRQIGARRVPGLRRGEVAALAGVSVEYYSKLERGAIAGVSASVLDAIARALQLDDAERAHLFHLAHAVDGTSAGMRPAAAPANAGRPVRACNGCSTKYSAPAIIRNGRMDLLASNHLGRAMYSTVYEYAAGDQPNFARSTFPGPRRCPRLLPRLGRGRRHVRRDPAHRSRPRPLRHDLHDLVGELSTRSEDFRRRWSAHNVRNHGAGTKHFHDHDVGDLELAYESVDMISNPGLTLTLYAAEPASPTANALDLLASWTAAADDTTVHDGDRP